MPAHNLHQEQRKREVRARIRRGTDVVTSCKSKHPMTERHCNFWRKSRRSFSPKQKTNDCAKYIICNCASTKPSFSFKKGLDDCCTVRSRLYYN